MRKRGERTLKELYHLTDRISEPEITPVLEGSCRIQGPADESEQELPSINSGVFPAEKGFLSVNENPRIRAESGTCNVCSAPCSSCMHLNRTTSAMESKIECSYTDNIFGRKESDSCSAIGVDGQAFYKSRQCNDHQHAVSEASNFLSASSSHDSYSENSESKKKLRASVMLDASDAVDMPIKASSSAAIGGDQPPQKRTNGSAHSLYSFHNRITHEIGDKIFPTQEEQPGSDYPAENISCITGVRDANAEVHHHKVDLHKKDASFNAGSSSSSLVNGIEDANKVEPARGFHDHGIEEIQSNSRRSITCHRESSPKKGAGSGSDNAGFFIKSETVEYSPSERIPAKVHSPCSRPQKGHPFHHDHESKNLERHPSFQFQVEPSDCSLENVESPLGRQLGDGNVIGQKHTELPNNEDNKAGHVKSKDLLGDPEDTDSHMETKIGMDSRSSSDAVVKHIITTEQNENSISFMEASNTKGPLTQPQSTPEIENSDSDIELADVKVCDICGDAGREELLAICIRCNDGAEHTYCMREKLDELPEGDWLCEECQMNDTENRKAEKSGTVCGSSKQTCLNENDQDLVSNSNPKLLSELDTKIVDPETAIKGQQSQQILTTWHSENQPDDSISSKRTSEASGGSTMTASPRKKTVLSRESSFKNLDTGKVKPGNMISSRGGQSANNSKAFSCSQTSLASNSLKVQIQHNSPRVPFSRSSSFSNAYLKQSPKVKHLIENVPHKIKNSGESTSGYTRKEGTVRTLTKSVSLKNASSVHCNIEPVDKTQSLNPSRGRDPSSLKQIKERSTIEKNTSFHDRPIVSPSQTAGVSLPLPKGDLKAIHDGKLNNAAESKGLSVNKGSVDTNGCKDVKKQSSYVSKSFGTQSFNGGNSEDQKPCQVRKEGVHASSSATDKSSSKAESFLKRGVSHASESKLRDEKTKDYTLLSSAKQGVSGGNRTLRCLRCNETGHVTQFCPVDKLSISVQKPSTEQNLKRDEKTNKWKDAVEAPNLKSGIKRKKLSDQTEFPGPSKNLSCVVALNDNLSSSSSCRSDLPFLEGTPDCQEVLRSSDTEPSKTTALTDIRQQLMLPVEASYATTGSDLNVLTTSDESNVEHPLQNSPNQALILAESSKASAIPELEFIWQGEFEVFRTGRVPEQFDGIQAHLSSCASPKVLEVVLNVPCKLQVEEVPRITSWPLQFHQISPKEDNIALFFFAKDVESYERRYRKLLENMLTNDLALRGNINGVELLVFPSNILPINSQRWNNLFFLWGIFIGRRPNCIETLRDPQKKTCSSILKKAPLVKVLSSPLISDVSNFKKKDICENPEMELSRSDRPPKEKAVMSTTFVDYQQNSTSGVDDRTSNTGVLPLVGNSLYRTVVDNKLLSERTSCLLPSSCSLESMNKLPGLLGSCPKPKLQLSTKMLYHEGKNATYLEKLSIDSERGKNAGHAALVRPMNYQARHLDSPTFTQGVDRGRREGRIKEEGKLTHSVSPPASSRETEAWKGRENSISSEDGREEKKTMKPSGEGHASSSSRDWKPSCRSPPILASPLNEEHNDPGDSKRPFFCVDLGPAKDDTETVVHVLSSDDEDSPEPDLELALDLGRREKPPCGKKRVSLPLLFPPTAEVIRDDASALSLSLAFPSPDRPLPERPDINTSLFPFGGFTDI